MPGGASAGEALAAVPAAAGGGPRVRGSLPGWRAVLPVPPIALLVWYAFASFGTGRALVASLAAAALVLLAAIDIERGIIPNRIVLPASALVLVLQLALFPGEALDWIAAPLVAGVAMLLPALFGRSWIGMGDVKLVLLLGVTLGWGVVGAVLLAFPCSLPVTLFMFAGRGLEARRASFPFGPFLALGGLLVLFGPTLLGVAG